MWPKTLVSKDMLYACVHHVFSVLLIPIGIHRVHHGSPCGDHVSGRSLHAGDGHHKADVGFSGWVALEIARAVEQTRFHAA